MRSAPHDCDSAVLSAGRLRRAGRRQADGRRHGGREAEHPDDAADAAIRRSTPTSTARSSTWAWTSTTCPIEPGKDVQLTHYWKLVASPGEGWKTFTHLNGAEQELHQRRPRAGEGQVPGRRLEGGRDHPRPAQHPAARDLGGADGRGLRRAVAAARRACRSRPDRTTPRGACWRRRSRSARSRPAAEARKRYVARMATKAPKIDGKLDDAVVDGGAVDGRRSSTR